jgi:tetratricopeptide (TPR) repeat protein
MDHPDVASSLNTVGSGYEKLNDNKKALDYYIKALQVRQRLFFYDHPDLVESLNNVGKSYGKLKENKKAFEYKLKALEMRQRLSNRVK